MQGGYVMMRGQVFKREDKEPFVPSGRSIHGALEYDRKTDRLRCHECGKWYVVLGKHVSRGHKIPGMEYRAKHGLNQGTSLIGQIARQKQSAQVTARPVPAGFGGANQRKATIAASNSPKRAGDRYEYRNEKGECQAQLLRKIQKKAIELGRTPKYSEFAPGEADMSARIFGSVGNAIKAAGLPPFRAELSRAILIELLQDFYVLNRRLPMDKDFGTASLPTLAPFDRLFGSFANACAAAGLAYIASSRYGRRVVAASFGQPETPIACSAT